VGGSHKIKNVQDVQVVSAKQFGADPSFGGQKVQTVKDNGRKVWISMFRFRVSGLGFE
jgi:hypothetical protein